MQETVASADASQRGFSAGEMVQIRGGHVQSYATHEASGLREAIEQFCDGTLDRINSRRLGNRLGHFRNRVCNGMAFDFSKKEGVRCWFVTTSGVSGVSQVSTSPPSY